MHRPGRMDSSGMWYSPSNLCLKHLRTPRVNWLTRITWTIGGLRWSAWVQLDKYYRRFDDCPVYYAAVALHPTFRWRYFEIKWADWPEWIASAKSKMQDLWESRYQNWLVSDIVASLRLSKTKASMVNPFHRYLDPSRFSSPFMPDLDNIPDDEYDRWQQLTDRRMLKLKTPRNTGTLRSTNNPGLLRWLWRYCLSLPCLQSARDYSLLVVLWSLLSGRSLRL